MDKESTATIKKELSYTLRVWQTTAIVCMALLILLFVRVAFNILLMTFTGVLIAIYFHGLAGFIAQKTKISQKISLFIAIAGTILLLNAMIWVIGSTVQQQATQLSHTLPQMIGTIKTKMEASAAGQQLLTYTAGDNSKKLMDTAGAFFSSGFGVLGDLYITLFLAIFFTADPSLYKNSLMGILPPGRETDGSIIWNRISTALKAWLKTKLISMVLITVVVAAGLKLLGLPGTLVLGLIAGLLDIIPNFGPVIAMTPGVLLGLMVSPQVAVVAALIYVACQTLVGSIFMPLIQKRMINIPPAITMISQLAMGIICGLMGIDTAKNVSDKIGRIMQDRESLSINRQDTSISRSKQLEAAVPPSRISALSSGEFVGLVADNPEEKIELKAFHCEIINDHEALKQEVAAYKELPVVRTINSGIVQRNYLQVKQDVQEIIQSEMERLLNDPALSHLVIKKS